MTFFSIGTTIVVARCLDSAYCLYMTKRQVLKAMAAANIVGRVSGSGEAWEVEVLDEATKELFAAKVAQVGGYKTGWGGWVLRPMQQGGLRFGTLDSAEQTSLLDFNYVGSKHHY